MAMCARSQPNLDLDGRVAATIEYLSRVYPCDVAHASGEPLPIW